MEQRVIKSGHISGFENYLRLEERSNHTIEKYLRDIRAFICFIGNSEISKELVISYKQHLISKGYAIPSINSMLSAVNSILSWLGWSDCKVKTIKTQRQIFCSEEKELSRAEYQRLLSAAQRRGNHRLYMVLLTLCGSGIRVSELSFITVEAVRKGKAVVSCKGKTRTVFLVKALQKKLLLYSKEQHILAGPVFVTRTGNPINRTNIWREMKSLSAEADVGRGKIFPHNLRHLFARVFYQLEKDIAKLADVLGHSSINTTRIYIVTTGNEHRQCMETMKLIL